jgi:ubiquinone/menaquinone biosynthesis C-methylase UbiE
MPDNKNENTPQTKHRSHIEGIPWPFSIFYNAVAKSNFFQKHYQLVAADIGQLCRQGRLLDIGTGPGWLLLAVKKQLPDIELTGIDIAPAMVALAQKNLTAAGKGDCPSSGPPQAAGTVPFTSTVAICQGSASTLSFPDNHFDMVVSTASMHHWPAPVESFNEIYRVLKPGGSALIYDLVRNVPKPIAQQLRREFGLFPVVALWLHSFEEPFYTTDGLLAIAKKSSFQTADLQFTGGLCRLKLQKN